METDFQIQSPHEEAAALIRDKPAITREVFDGLLPELRGRAFTITGVEGAGVLQRTRDAIAGVATGETWDAAKKEIISELDPWLGDGAENRAELLLRTHAFQAFQAANWRVAQEDADTTHLQYLTMEDEAVRDSHAALDGVILPKDDPFWQKHYPPWEWNCRCLARPINYDFVAEERAKDANRNPEDRNVIEGPALTQLRDGTLIRGTRRFDVTAPSDSQSSTASSQPFEWHPDNLRIPLKTLEARYDADVWKQFEGWAQKAQLDESKSVWDWLSERQREFVPKENPRTMAGAAPGGIATLMDKFKAAGFKKPLLDTIKALPHSVAPFLESLLVASSGRKGAHYVASKKTLYMTKDPKSWNGHPSTAVHEIGHHLHYETGAITAHHVSPTLRAAILEDWNAFQKWAEEKIGADWRDKLTSRTFISVETVSKLLGYTGDFGSLTITQKHHVGRWTDMIMAISGGEYGCGHSRFYMIQNGAKEAFTHAWTGFVDKDAEFANLFSAVTAEVKKILSL